MKRVNVIGDLRIAVAGGGKMIQWNCAKRKGFRKKAKQWNKKEVIVINKTTNEEWVFGLYFTGANPMIVCETLDEYMDLTTRRKIV